MSYDDGKVIRSMPASWTDAIAPTPFVAVSDRRARIRAEDLFALVELVEACRATGGGEKVSAKSCRTRKAKNAAHGSSGATKACRKRPKVDEKNAEAHKKRPIRGAGAAKRSRR